MGRPRWCRGDLLMQYLFFLLSALLAFACNTAIEPDGRDQQTGYRSGSVEDDYLSNGERGNITITEVFWSGSVEDTGDGYRWDPTDVFIEVQNKHPRPVYLTGWLVKVEKGRADEGIFPHPRANRSEQTLVIPERTNGQPLYPNDYAIIAAKNTGAFPDADYVLDGLSLPQGPFEITIRDLDERLIDHIGDDRKPPFAGSWDGVVSRSMERIQLIFNNRGSRDSAWHTYGLNDFDEGDRGAFHTRLRTRIAERYQARTFASPGGPNSPDYSGNTSSGSFE